MVTASLMLMAVFVISGFSSDSDLPSLTVDADSLAEVDDGMASCQGSPSRTFGLSVSVDPSAAGAVASDSEPSKAEERESRSLFPSSLKPRLGRRDYLEKAGELIKLALKKEEEDDYEAAADLYRKGVDLLLEGVQGTVHPQLCPGLAHAVRGSALCLEALCSVSRRGREKLQRWHHLGCLALWPSSKMGHCRGQAAHMCRVHAVFLLT